MILESRSIIFSDEELFLALRPVIESRGLSSDITVASIVTRLDEEGEVAVTLEVTGKESLEFSSRELGAAVLNHCIDQGIPLPRGSYKELATRGDHIALIVRMESGIAHTEADMADE
ncbi:MAG: hypothetical protein KUG56_08595 [Kordiimonadaceae bacterium]|nr:hypothetical protein [Kordiimonadaceae bacterium]